jgi:hypothetical protein
LQVKQATKKALMLCTTDQGAPPPLRPPTARAGSASRSSGARAPAAAPAADRPRRRRSSGARAPAAAPAADRPRRRRQPLFRRVGNFPFFHIFRQFCCHLFQVPRFTLVRTMLVKNPFT